MAGSARIDLDRYPRIMFRIDVRLSRHVDLTSPAAEPGFEALRCASLNPSDLSASQAVGACFFRAGIQGVLFPSVAGPGSNIIVFRDNTRPGDVVLFNREKLIRQLQQFAENRD